MKKAYIVSNTKSEYFGTTVYEVERYKRDWDKELWIKIVCDFVDHTGSFKETYTWFKIQELEEV